MSTPRPTRASVLAVGIERYDWGEDLNLPGAATHAVRFAQWAASNGITTDPNTVASSWLETSTVGEVDGASRVETTRDDLESALLSLMDEGGDILFLYWCGHGVTEDGSRLLLTSNATNGNQRNLSLSEIERLLRSTRGRGFDRVVMLVDACANFVEYLNAERTFPKTTFGELNSREIFLSSYYSTDLGQIAEYNHLNRAATFSTFVIDWLEKSLTGWPPDMEVLRAEVSADFEHRALTGEFRQTPVSLLINTGLQTTEVDYYSPTQADLQPSQVRRLTRVVIDSGMLSDGVDQATETVLGGSDDLESRVTKAFRNDRGSLLIKGLAGLIGTDEAAFAYADILTCWNRQRRVAPLLSAFSNVTREQLLIALIRELPPGTECRAYDLANGLEYAASLTPPVEGGIDPLHRVVALLEALTGLTVPNGWFELDNHQLTGLRNTAAERVAPTHTTLIIDLRSGGSPVGINALPSVVTAYVRRLRGNPIHTWERYEAESGTGEFGAPTLSGVQAAVQSLLDRLHGEGEASLDVGFLIPRALQDLSPEMWPLLQDYGPPRPFGAEHPTVLHSGERLTGQPRTGAKWRKRAADIEAAVAVSVPEIAWVGDASRREPRGIRETVEATEAPIIALEFVLGAAPDDLSSDPIIAAVMGGAPYVVWTESEPEDWEIFREQVRDLIQNGAFAHVKERLHTFRRNQPDAHFQNLRVLWDDPHLLAPVLTLRGPGTLDTEGEIGNA